MKLGELISKRRADLGLSLEKMCVRAREQGYDLTRTTLSAFETKPLAESPKRRTMEALAVALDVPYGDVVMAVASAMAGTDMVEAAETQHVRAWLTLTEGMNDEQIERMLRVVRSVADALDTGHQQSTPNSAERSPR
ncbi:hypothetical protein [Pseudonocardia sp. McavD-2-B]|uniref:hypothetical protein n=1 Tax=Pseudonocardia sp. McavD-2-B TaxID=2954499 RepID=UPI0020970F8E|nr:hypothetical protein [Pseudonocardia sp. McavD-2-B]MCO7192295.1 hypothetical protein [Pseudonocardia sp. McavD-2-B]